MSVVKIRLCVDQPLGPGQSLRLSEAQAHYLFSVMRAGPDARVLAFNGRDGEWLAEVAAADRRRGTLVCLDRIREQVAPADLWLLFAPVKKARTDTIVEKAVELGVARLVPVAGDFTNAERFRSEKARAHVREAAEQCGALHLADVAEVAPLVRVLDAWDPRRRILWADEGLAKGTLAGRSSPPVALLAGGASGAGRDAGPWAVLIGPEGGFSAAERGRLRALPFVTPIALGPRILRAETAAIAALALWQAHLGDWR